MLTVCTCSKFTILGTRVGAQFIPRIASFGAWTFFRTISVERIIASFFNLCFKSAECLLFHPIYGYTVFLNLIGILPCIFLPFTFVNTIWPKEPCTELSNIYVSLASDVITVLPTRMTIWTRPNAAPYMFIL